jgi:hypothetical protein
VYDQGRAGYVGLKTTQPSHRLPVVLLPFHTPTPTTIATSPTMGLGVLDDTHLEHVPGTALLTDIQGSNKLPLRHDKGKDSDVLLVPQPSSSPNDPLNWPLWKKDLILFLICIDTAVVGAWVWK